MRVVIAVAVCFLSFASSAACDDGPTSLDETQRAAALRQADALMEEAERLRGLRRFDKAIEQVQQALTLREQALGPADIAVAKSLATAAELWLSSGQPAQARGLLERAAPLLEARLGPSHAWVAYALALQSQALRGLGDYEAHGPLMERAEHILSQAPASDGLLVSDALYTLGHLRRESCQYDVARLHLDRAVVLREKILGAQDERVLDSYGMLASVLTQQHQFAAAKVLLEQVLRVRESTLGPEHAATTWALSELGRLEHARGAYATALEYYREALARETRGRGNKVTIATTLQCIGAQHLGLREYETARDHLAQALEAFTSLAGSQHPYRAIFMLSLGKALRGLGRHEEARKLFEDAIALGEAVADMDNTYAAEAFAQLGMTLAALGQPTAAREAIARSLGITERAMLRDLRILHGPERFARTSSMRAILSAWVALAPQLGETGYAEVLRLKGIVGRAEAADRRLSRRSALAHAPAIAALEAAERKLGLVSMALPPTRDVKVLADWKARVAAAAADRSRCLRELGAAGAPLHVGQARLELGLPDIQAHLAPDEVLVDMLHSQDRYFAWVVRHQGPAVRFDLGEARAIEEAAERFATLSASEKTTLQTPEWIEAGRALRELVIAPIEPHLGEGVRSLVLAPEAALAATPLAALPSREEGRFLIDDYVLRFVAQAQDLVPWPDAAPTGTRALLVGGADYETAAGASQAKSATPPVLGGVVAERGTRAGPFQALPNSAVEVMRINQMLGGTELVLKGADATESAVKSLATGRRILHLATHGFVLEDRLRSRERVRAQGWLGAEVELQHALDTDALLLAGLALAGANSGSGAHGDDGILTALEASRLHLDGVELVVLSACKTALGRSQSGEGVVGLVQGFQMAGARSVIASLWNVGDAPTRALMEAFYEAVLRKPQPPSPAEALRTATLALRDGTGPGQPAHAAPSQWAAFVAYAP